jgi:hypothetical protein
MERFQVLLKEETLQVEVINRRERCERVWSKTS